MTSRNKRVSSKKMSSLKVEAKAVCSYTNIIYIFTMRTKRTSMQLFKYSSLTRFS